ncbi:MAG: GNAT family N-acetyltransferase [Bacteroidota bacterium]
MMDAAIQISSDRSLLDVNKIHGVIKSSYWGSYRSVEQTKKTIENSLCFGAYCAEEQIGFARVLTDEVVLAHIMDVVIFEGYKGKGIGKRLMEYILKDSRVRDVLSITLKTKDAHTFYEKYGFKKVGNSKLWMAIDRAKLE